MRYSNLLVFLFFLSYSCTSTTFDLDVRSYANEFIEANINGKVVRANAVASGYVSDIYRYYEDSVSNFVTDFLQISRQTENNDYQFYIWVNNQTLHEQTFPITITSLTSPNTDANMTVFQSPRSEDMQIYWGAIEITITNWGPDNIMEGTFTGVLTQHETTDQLNVEDGSFRLYVVKDID